MTVLATGRIDDDAHQWFVDLSRDTSPLHVDVAHARRSPVGERVVHGAHLVLSMVEEVGRAGRSGWNDVSAAFRNPLAVGQPFAIERVSHRNADEVTARAVGDRVVLAEVTLRAGTASWPCSAELAEIDNTVTWMGAPTDAVGAMGLESLAVDADLLSLHAPHVDPGLAAAVCAASRIAGMRCPGQLALLRGFSLAPGRGGGGAAWRVARVRDSLRLIIIDVTGGIDGRIEVGMRHSLVQQPGPDELAGVVSAGEFGDLRALVLGGTRGLGLLAARILAAGGAEVVTVGRDVSAEEHMLPFELLDVTSPDPGCLTRLRAFGPTHLLHFATPPIPRRIGRPWSDDLHDGYVRVYEGGLGLAARLAGPRPLKVLYPSTVFIDERPSGFAEYIAAKESSEQAAEELSARYDSIAVTVERLPVLTTDQTAGATSALPSANLDVMIPLMRSFAGAPS